MTNRLLHLLTCSAVALMMVTPMHADEPKAPKGFTALFNGKDFAGWHGMPHFDPTQLAELPAAERTQKLAEWNDDFKKHWTIENAELVNDGHGPYATTDKEYKNIELQLEYKTVAKADSGIYLRATPQVQIWDWTEEAKFKHGSDKGSGGLWNSSPGAPGKDPLVLADKPFGEWNKFRIIQAGDITTVYLNDKLVVDHAKMENYWDKDRKTPLRESGQIQLQTHGGEIRWRNIFIRELPKSESEQIIKVGAEKAAAAPKAEKK